MFFIAALVDSDYIRRLLDPLEGKILSCYNSLIHVRVPSSSRTPMSRAPRIKANPTSNELID